MEYIGPLITENEVETVTGVYTLFKGVRSNSWTLIN